MQGDIALTSDDAQVNDVRDAAYLAARQTTEDDDKETTDGKNVITTSKSLGTTDDKKGYRWRPVGSGLGLAKRQGLDQTKIADGNVVTVSKSQGTTHDTNGYKWHSTGL